MIKFDLEISHAMNTLFPISTNVLDILKTFTYGFYGVYTQFGCPSDICQING